MHLADFRKFLLRSWREELSLSQLVDPFVDVTVKEDGLVAEFKQPFCVYYFVNLPIDVVLKHGVEGSADCPILFGNVLIRINVVFLADEVETVLSIDGVLVGECNPMSIEGARFLGFKVDL